MTSLEDRLQRALATEGVAGGDPGFRIEIIIRRERSAAYSRIAGSCTMASAIAILTWVGRSAVGALLGIGTAQPTSIAIAAAALAALMTASSVARPVMERAFA